MGKNQYVFSFESVLNENKDWILAVMIPLQGEEVMILPDLSKIDVQGDEIESLEERIGKEFQELKLNQILTARELLRELRSLVRFALTKDWGGAMNCQARQSLMICYQDQQEFLVLTSGGNLIIKKSLAGGRGLQLVAKSLTESIFKKIDILFLDSAPSAPDSPKTFLMEFFW